MIKVQATTDKGEEIIKASEKGFVADWVTEVELAGPLLTIPIYNEKTKRSYGQALCLVRLHTFPLGLVQLPFHGEDLTPQRYLPLIWETLSQQINDHLQQDGLVSISELNEGGLVTTGQPRCLQEQERFIEQAPFISILVATRDRPQQIDTCLQRLLLLNYPNYEIIVVDNAPSSAETAQLLQQRYQHEAHIRYVYGELPGLSNARNVGLKKARGEIVAMIDDDVTVDTNWLLEIARAFSRSEDVVCVTGLVLPLELETPAQKWFEEFGGFSKGFVEKIYDMKLHRPNIPLYPYRAGIFGTGANMAFRHSFLRTIEGFNPALGAGTPTGGGEDLAAFFRVITRGHQLVYTPSAIAYHEHRRDFEGLVRQMYFYGTGLFAFLIDCLIEQPLRVFDILFKIPQGLFFIFSANSPKNQKKSTTFPKELTQAELRGMKDALIVYMRSKRALKRMRRARSTLSIGTQSLSIMP